MEYGAFSHKGLQRKSNEDYYMRNEDKPAIMMVADGMGAIMRRTQAGLQ